jgi:hypothetical protein
MTEACSFCNRRLGRRRSAEVRTLHTVSGEFACDHCLTTLAALALRSPLPDARKLAAVISREIQKKAKTAGDAEEIRARMLAAAPLPDVVTAVENLVYIVEHEAEKPSTGRDAETNAAARGALQALVFTKHVPTAKRFVAGEREKTHEAAARAGD